MYKILVLFILALPLFSQKLWEIEVDPSDYLRDVVEIPNSDLLLFTYNTGKLEIRNSQDGSFVNQLIKKSNESGELRISNNGQLYYYQSAYDTLEYRDIRTNEAIIRVSPEIEGLEGNPIFDGKTFRRFEIYDNNTKIVGNMIYFDSQDSRNDVNYFIIYDIPKKTVEYKDDPYDYKYNYISKSYLSPDDKYFIETAYNQPFARMFNLETREYEFEFDGEESDEESYKLGALQNGRFQGNNFISVGSADEYILFSFPELNIIEKINFYKQHNLFISQPKSNSLCNDISILTISERYPNEVTKYYRYFIKYNFENKEIIYNSKSLQSNLDYCYVFSIDNCNKLIIDRDYDYRAGIIACYNYNTLEIETPINNFNYFFRENTNINFISQEFIGQTARIEIYNSVGAVVGTLYNGIINQPNYSFQIPELPSGTYYLQCQLSNQNLNFNFVVAR